MLQAWTRILQGQKYHGPIMQSAPAQTCHCTLCKQGMFSQWVIFAHTQYSIIIVPCISVPGRHCNFRVFTLTRHSNDWTALQQPYYDSSSEDMRIIKIPRADVAFKTTLMHAMAIQRNCTLLPRRQLYAAISLLMEHQQGSCSSSSQASATPHTLYTASCPLYTP